MFSYTHFNYICTHAHTPELSSLRASRVRIALCRPPHVCTKSSTIPSAFTHSHETAHAHLLSVICFRHVIVPQTSTRRGKTAQRAQGYTRPIDRLSARTDCAQLFPFREKRPIASPKARPRPQGVAMPSETGRPPHSHVHGPRIRL